MDSIPNKAPPKPAAAKGSCQVNGTEPEQFFTVNLDDMTCDCPHGAPWYLPEKGKTWKPRNLCNHKLKAIASLCSKDPTDTLLRDYYDEQLGKRYNAFEVVSAFHKELRIGNVNNAQYWATMLVPHRGKHGVITYMRNILFEETRDLPLAKMILRLSSHGRDVTILDMQRAVARFTKAPKKWELPWRHAIFLDEQRGYKRLITAYGVDVAKGKDIIDADQTPTLKKALLEGFKNAHRPTVQNGLKGWFKSKSADHDKMKLEMFNMLIGVMNEEHPNAFEYNEEYAMDLYNVLMRRAANHGGVGYHELNALCDALTGEDGYDPAASLPAKTHKTIMTYPKVRRVKLGGFKMIPLYAHDNHTWGGKAKMRRHPEQLEPNANQVDMDFRLCGAYMGVCWRTLAFKQHGTIDCKWSDVAWTPKWLWGHLDSMWY
jgi:hypothetical protein